MGLLKKKDCLPDCSIDESVIVIGTGPVGIEFAKAILSNKEVPSLTLFGGEPWEPYNRVKLSSYFAGQIDFRDLMFGKNINGENVNIHNNCKIEKIDPIDKTVVDEFGNVHCYTKLVLATGSRPRIPKIKGIDLKNIFTFRDMSDIEKLLARRTHSRKTAVIGGGVLGIEAAKAMSMQNTEVTIIDHSMRLMSNQLDDNASELLREHILSLGIKVFLGQGIKEFQGQDKIEKIFLSDGRKVEFDSIILTTGIIPNIDLAREARLSVGRGIRVNDVMQTSDPNIYAVGECAEHRGKVYGVVKPGYEQAMVAAYSLYGKKANYTGSLSTTQVKVIDIQVFSMGDVYEVSSVGLKKEYVYEDKLKGIYRKIIIKKYDIVGAISVGEWNDLGRIQEAITKKRFIPPWSLIRFKKTGSLWSEESSNNINEWPASTIICNCTGVTRGQLSEEIKKGVNTLSEVCERTTASTVCGGCKPLVSQLLTGISLKEPVQGMKSIFALGMLTALIILLSIFLPSIPFASTFEGVWQWDMVWRENIYKQISGYSLLTLSAISLILSLRKRISNFTLSSFPVWRVIHVVLGFIAVIGLAVHSGYRMGSGLNYFLALSFIAILFAGAASSIVVGLEHKMDVALSRSLKNKFVWLHILAFWPFPVLLAAHIFKSYYF